MNKLFNILVTALVFVSGSAFAGCGSCKKSTTKTMQRKNGRRLSSRVAVRAAALHRVRCTRKAKQCKGKSCRSKVRSHRSAVKSVRSTRRAGCRSGSCKRKSVATPMTITSPVVPAPSAPVQAKSVKGGKKGSDQAQVAPVASAAFDPNQFFAPLDQQA